MDRMFWALLSFLFISQTSFARTPLTEKQLADVIGEFQYQAQYKEIKSDQVQGGWYSSCWVYEKEIQVVYPQSEQALSVHMMMYIPNRDDLEKDQVPAVIMVPPIGGVNLLDKKTAGTLCSNNMAALILTDDFANIESQAKGALKPIEDHEQAVYRIVGAVKGTIEMINDDVNMDANHVGLFGVSLGGILSAFVMGTQPEISAGYFVVAGGDIPHILATSEQNDVAQIRQKRMDEQGFTSADDYEDYIRDNLHYDPADLGPTMVPETLRMVIAEQDTSVPSDNQVLLHDAFGQPKADYFNEGHVTTVISFLFPGSGRRKVSDFFKKRFAEQNPRPALFSNFIPYLPMAAM